MKKYFIKAELITILTAFILLAVMMTAADIYAGNHYVDLEENQGTRVIWTDGYDSEAVTYMRIKPTKTGTITFTANFQCYVALCDEDYKLLSIGYYSEGDSILPNNNYDFMKKVHYGVKKNKIYNLKVYLMPNYTDDKGRYSGVVKYTTTKVKTAKHGSSKKKAKAIKKNKKIKGLFVGGNKKAQWYKVTNKQKKTLITISADKINYALDIKVYYKDGKKWKNASTNLTWQADYKKDTFQGTINKKAKHTYYIKVTPKGKTSGSYTIKWK